MTEYSYNGWRASRNPADFGGLAKLTVAGEDFAPGVRAGDVHTVLEYVATQLHLRVEPVVKPEWHQADDWGYSFRPNTNNPSELSCHASGTAIDYNATRHPNGAKDTWTPAQQVEIKKILAEVNNVVRILWHYDEMHFEICAGEAAVRVAALKVKGMTAPAPVVVSLPTLKEGDTGARVLTLQRFMNRVFPAYSKIDLVPQRYGPQTRAVMKEFQYREKITGSDADGTIVGPRTNAALAKYGYRNG